MDNNHYEQLAEIVQRIYAVRGLSFTNAAFEQWATTLGAYPPEIVERAVNEWFATQPGMPWPAQINQIVLSYDGRPSPDEAWTMAVQAADEHASVLWTDEIAVAWGVAAPSYEPRNSTAARMAFRESYTRLVAEAREALRPVAWRVSLGLDVAGREVAINDGKAKGLLAARDWDHLLPAPMGVVAEPQRLAGPPTGSPADAPEPSTLDARNHAKIIELRKQLEQRQQADARTGNNPPKRGNRAADEPKTAKNG